MANYPIARVRKLVIYPAKGIAGAEVNGAMLAPSGMSYKNYADHQFMIVSNDPEFVRINQKKPSSPDVYCFVTQRDMRSRHDEPQGLSVMALIKPRFAGNELDFTWNYQDPVKIPYDNNSGEEIPVRVWDHETRAVDQGDKISEWLSDCLNLDVRLVKAAGSFQRMARQNYMANSNPVYFHDGYPVHWFPIETVHELSGKAGELIPWQSFRPQIVVEGMSAQYDHRIHEGRIADIPFTQPKPCDRCPVTTISQETGEIRDKTQKYGKLGREPLLTLQQYKMWITRHLEIKPIFGENMNPCGSGLVCVGDDLVVTSERDPPIEYGSMEIMARKLKDLKAARQ